MFDFDSMFSLIKKRKSLPKLSYFRIRFQHKCLDRTRPPHNLFKNFSWKIENLVNKKSGGGRRAARENPEVEQMTFPKLDPIILRGFSKAIQ